MKIRSKRTDLSYEAVVYAKPNPATGAEDLILRHTFLQSVYDSLMIHGKVRFHPVRKAFENGSPVVESYSFYDIDNGIYSVGELTWDEYNASGKDSVLRKNPNAYALNRCFDKWFIRYMEFEVSADYAGKIYSDAEIPIGSAVPVSGRNLTRDVEQAEKMQESKAQEEKQEKQLKENTPADSAENVQGMVYPAAQSPAENANATNTLLNPLIHLGGGERIPAFAGNIPAAPAFSIPMPAPFTVPQGTSSVVIGPGNLPGALKPAAVSKPEPSQNSTQELAGSSPQIEVIKCEYDFANAAALVITNQGTLLYSSVTSPPWKGVTLDPKKVPDLSKLYESASKMIGMPLDQFSGIPSFAGML